MANMTVRNLPDDIYSHLRDRAAANRRSLEAEVRSILVQSVISGSSKGFGERVRKRYGEILGDELTVERDRTASKPASFE